MCGADLESAVHGRTLKLQGIFQAVATGWELREISNSHPTFFLIAAREITGLFSVVNKQVQFLEPFVLRASPNIMTP